MKVILTKKREITNIEQIKNLLNIILFDYDIEIMEKSKNKKKNAKKEIKKQVEEKQKKIIIQDSKKIKKKSEWLEDYYYTQSRDKEYLDSLINHYSKSNDVSEEYY